MDKIIENHFYECGRICIILTSFLWSATDLKNSGYNFKNFQPCGDLYLKRQK